MIYELQSHGGNDGFINTVNKDMIDFMLSLESTGAQDQLLHTRITLENHDEKRAIAVALVNLDHAFALYFSIENSLTPIAQDNARMDAVREAYMKFFDWFSKADAADDIYPAAEEQVQLMDEYYSSLSSRIGLE